MNVLNSRDVKEVKQLLKEQFGYTKELDVIFLKKGDDIFIIHKDIEEVDVSRMRMNTVGLYFAELKGGMLRLSRDGSQMIGPHATKNVVEIGQEQLKQYYIGEDINIDAHDGAFVLLRYEEHYIACGKVRNGKILNYLSKIYRSPSIIA